MKYSHIQKISNKKEQLTFIKGGKAWTRKTYAGNSSPVEVDTVTDLYDRGKITEIFIRYGKTLVAKVDSTTWFETESY